MRLSSVFSIVTLSILTIVFAGAGVLNSASAAGPEFKKYSSKEGNFSVDLAGKLFENSEDVEGTTLNTTKALINNGLLLEIAWYDEPEAEKYDSPQAFLKELMQNSFDGPFKNEQEITLGESKIPGREFTTKDAGFNFRQREYLAGKRVYRVQVIAKAEADLTGDTAKRFFDSFKVQE